MGEEEEDERRRSARERERDVLAQNIFTLAVIA